MSTLLPGVFAPKGYQQLDATALGSAVGLTVPKGATYALIQCDTAPVRWRDDGTNPSSTVGMSMTNGQEPQGFAGDLSALKFIAASGSPKLNVSYYG